MGAFLKEYLEEWKPGVQDTPGLFVLCYDVLLGQIFRQAVPDLEVPIDHPVGL